MCNYLDSQIKFRAHYSLLKEIFRLREKKKLGGGMITKNPGIIEM